MANQSILTIGLPVFNGQRHLAEALESLRRQSFTDFTVIVSDNASSDQTSMICTNQACADTRIVYQRNAVNIGATGNFNKVMQQAHSKYFMWAAADDVWEPDFAQVALRGIEDPEVAIAFTRFDNIDDAGRGVRQYPGVLRLGSQRSTLGRLHSYLWFPEHRGKANFVHGIMRTKVLQQTGGMRYYSPNEWGADMFPVFRLASVGRFSVADRTLFHKRLPSSQVLPKTIWWRWAPSIVPEAYLRDYTRVLDYIQLSGRERMFLSLSVRTRIIFNRALARGRARWLSRSENPYVQSI